MRFDANQENFRELLKIIENDERRVVPFIGAGLSLYGNRDERLPLWGELIEALVQKGVENSTIDQSNVIEINQLIEEGKYISATDVLLKYIGEPNFRIFIQRIFDITDKPIPPAISCFICISWSLIVTTNLDKFIERAWVASGTDQELEVVTNKNIHQLAQSIGNENTKKSTLLKIHGSVENYESWILTKKHYQNLLSREDYVYALKNLFLKTLFFVGYGLNDDDFEVLLLNLKILYPAGVGSYFALLDSRRKVNKSITHLIREYGLQPIWYTSYSEKKDEPDGGHGEVLECIQLLVNTWIRKNRSIKICLKYFAALDPDFVGRSKELKKIESSLFCDHPDNIEIIGFGGEGKTSILQYFIETRKDRFAIENKFEMVFGCSFYRVDVGRFINDALSVISPETKILGIPDKVHKLIHIFSTRRILLILDGLEAVQNKVGHIRNPYLNNIINSVLNGNSTLVTTSRVSLSAKKINMIKLEALSKKDVDTLFNKWGIDSGEYHIRRLIKEQVGRHALSVRILAGFIKQDRASAMELLNNLGFHEIRDEADLLRANKVYRILDSYKAILPDTLLCFMQCFSIFYNPVHLSVILNSFAKDLGEEAANHPLIGKDLRPIILALQKLRLIILEPGDLLTTHPTIREYFRANAICEKLYSLHSQIARFLIKSLGETQPKNFIEAYHYFDLCYHAASSKQWELFHYYFYNIINRGHKNYLGYSIEAWDEIIYLASLTFPENNLKFIPEIEPIYYISTIARAFKHIGESEKAQEQYLKCIELCIENQESETAKYVNNLLTLSISTGELATAIDLIKFNIGTLSWQTTDWKYNWQYEHAFYSIGYLLSLINKTELAENYCRHASLIWRNFGKKRDWFFFYHSIFYCDIMLTLSKDRHAESITTAKAMLAIARKNNWKETIVLSYRSLATSYRIKFQKSGKSKHLSIALKMIKEGMKITDTLFLPRFEIEILLEYLRVMLVQGNRSSNNKHLILFDSIIDRVKNLIQRGNFMLYKPELHALKGWSYYFKHNKDRSIIKANQAVHAARQLGYANIIVNDLFSLSPLLKTLAIQADEDPNPIEFDMDIASVLSINIEPEDYNMLIKTN